MRQIFACASLLFLSHAALAVPVFPGAVGFGTETEAGRGGTIVRVTKLTDDGTAGTLRDAVTNPAYGSRRIIVFERSGIITLTRSIKVTQSNTTIAGQTAPPPGIMIRGADLIVGANNVLVQHIHARVGDDPDGPPLDQRSGFHADGVATPGISNIVFDHVSAAWTTDQTFLVWSSGGPLASNITVSNSILAEGLRRNLHPKQDPVDGHSTGPLFGSGARNVTMYRSISAYNRWRNPLVRSNASGIQVVNNFFYWPRYRERARFHSDIDQLAGADSFKQVSSFHGNSYFATPEQSSQNLQHVAWVSTTEANTLDIYVNDNRLFTPVLGATSRADGGTLRPTATDQPWDLVEYNTSDLEITKLQNPPAAFPVLPLISSDKVEKFLLANAGARSAYRDEIDSRVIGDIESGDYNRRSNLDLGYVDRPEQVGGYPVWASQQRPFASLPNDNGDSDGDTYTNLEERLHEMAFRLEGDRRVARFDTFEDNEYASNWHIESAAFALSIEQQADGTRWLKQGANNTDARAMLLKTYFYDTVVQATVKPLSFENETRFVRVYARYRDKERNYHLLLRENDRVEIRRQDGPTSTLLGTFASLPINTTDQYAVRLSVVGGAISARVENLTTLQVVTLSATDPNPLPPGFAGTGTFFASARFDNFFAGPTGTAVPQLIEDFDDGNETGWAESNGSWTVVSSSGSPVYRQNLNTEQLLARASWNTNVASPNQSVQATVRPLEFNGNSFVSVHARYVDPNNSYYVTLRNDRRFELKKVQNGVVDGNLTRTVTMHSTFRLDEPHTLKIEVVGTDNPVLVGYLDGAPLLTVEDDTDPPFIGAGKAAVGTYGARAEFDNIVLSSP